MAQLYKDAGKAGKRNYEVVLIGMDRPGKPHHKYAKKMPWPTLKQEENKTNLVYKIADPTFVPAMVATDLDGEVIATGEKAVLKLLKKPVK